ncbi:hypothetical protein Tco_0597942 [Tanacetum coccineum]
MSTQQDIYAASSENHPPMLNKDNYVPWSSRLLCYAKSNPNGKLMYNSIINGPYTDDELTDKEVKQMEANDQAIQTILNGLPEDIYVAVDSYETAQEIWFTSTDGESIESYYHRFSKLMNDFKQNKHFPEKIASNLKFLNNLQPKWKRHITIVRQTKDLHEVDYTQLYDFLKMNQEEADCLTGYEYRTRQTDADGWRNEDVQNAVQNPGVQNVRNQNGLIVVSGIANQNANYNGNGNVLAVRAKGDLDEIEEVNANCILIANLQQASTSGTQTNKAPVYDSNRSAEIHEYDNCYNNEIFNIFTQEEQYNELLEPITEPHQVK